MKKIQKSLCVFMCLIGSIASVSAVNINLVDVSSTKTLSVSLSEKDNLSEGVQNAEVKVLKDTTIDVAEKSIDNVFQVTITLPEPLTTNTSYSLLSLFGAEGSIDFSTGEELVGNNIQNENVLPEEQSIESIMLVDENTIEIMYSTEVLGSEFEYKLLSELRVKDIENISNEDTRLTINLEDDIELQKDYILMFLSLIDNQGNEVELEESVFDFVSPEYIEDVIDVPTEIQETPVEELVDNPEEDIQPIIEDDESGIENTIQARIAASNQRKLLEQETEDSDVAMDDMPIYDEAEIELQSAGEEGNTNLLKDTVTTALEASTTPDTGAETWVLVFLTLVINTFYYCSRRKIA